MTLAQKAAEVMWREDEASRALGMKLEDVAAGRAQVSMKIQKSMANGQKVCHGGFIFTLAASAFGYACNTRNQRAASENGETVALFRGQSATVKGTWA